MIAALLLIVLLLTVPVVIGFRKSRSQRRVDRRDFAAFVGFSAGIVASIFTVIFFTAISAWFRSPEGSYFYSAKQGLVFVSGSIGLISSAVALLAGAFSSGTRRIILVIFGPVMGLIYVLAAFSNFGA